MSPVPIYTACARKHAKRARTIGALRRLIILVMGGDDLLGRNALLDPAHECTEDIVIGIRSSQRHLFPVRRQLVVRKRLVPHRRRNVSFPEP